MALVTLAMSEKTSGIKEKIDVCRDGVRYRGRTWQADGHLV